MDSILERFCKRLVALDMDIFGLRKQPEKVVEDDRWITVHPGGKGMKADGSGMKGGTPVLLNDEGEVIGGMGGKFKGTHIAEVRKSFEGPIPSPFHRSEYKKAQAGEEIDAFEEARRARREARLERAQKNYSNAINKIDTVSQSAGWVPGQPIVNERMRRDVSRFSERMDNAMSDYNKASERLERMQRLADTPDTSISGLDPNAVSKLDKDIERRKNNVEKFKDVKKKLKGVTDKAKAMAIISEAKFDGEGPSLALEEVRKWKDASHKEIINTGEYTLASWGLTNYQANIRRLEKRKEQLQKQKNATPFEKDYGNFAVKTDKEENRINFTFPGIPDSNTRELLKSHGFKWSPSRNAWTRQNTPNAAYATKQLLKQLTQTEEE